MHAANKGDVGTDEVIEIYAKDEESPFAPLSPILCGFKRIHLRAGEEAVFTITPDPNAFTVVTEDGMRIPGSGKYTLYAGFGAPDRRTEALTGQKAFSVTVA